MKRSAFIGSIWITALLATSGAFLGCQKKPETRPTATLPAIPSTSAATASQKLRDFRINPPLVEDASMTRGQGGSPLLEVKFAPDERFKDRITLMPDEMPVDLHDDGRDGDRQAGDRVFTAHLPGRFDDLLADQQRTVDAIQKRGGARRLFTFRGREIVDSAMVDSKFVTAALSRDKINLLINLGGLVVDENASLAITDKSVVEDPSRTFNPCPGAATPGTPGGKWTFGYLMRQMANTPVSGIDASDFVQRWLQRWLTNQSVNGFNVPARPAMSQLIARWPKLPDGRLDIDHAPVKLLAIINRIDLGTNPVYGGGGNAGEGRFVFGVLDGNCSPTSFLIIFEFGIPKHSCVEIRNWAQAWLDLANFAIGSTQYNAALEAITEQFAAANADPSKPNGSALNQLRTNEIALAGPWELREFRIFGTDSDAGQLREVTVKQTPDKAQFFQGGTNNAKLASWINANAAAIKSDAHTVPADLPFPDLIPFLGGSSPNNIDFWNATGINDNDARHHFSLNTCNACHGRETNTGFFHVAPTPFGQPTHLSGFMIGDGNGGPLLVTDPVPDPVTNVAVIHEFFDLQRRAQVLSNFANKNCFRLISFRPLLMTH